MKIATGKRRRCLLSQSSNAPQTEPASAQTLNDCPVHFGLSTIFGSRLFQDFRSALYDTVFQCK